MDLKMNDQQKEIQYGKISRFEEAKIKLIYFLLGIILCLPINILINLSFLINNIYNENISILLIAFLSTFMIVSSIAQLTLDFVSFKSIMICNILNAINMFFILISIMKIEYPKYYFYLFSSLIGLNCGFLYSASIKYSLLFNMRVNAFLVFGISFCALFSFIISSTVSYFIIEEHKIKSYYYAVILAMAFIVAFITLISLCIIHMYLKSPFFMKEKERIEAIKSIKKCDINELETKNEVNLKIRTMKTEINNKSSHNFDKEKGLPFEDIVELKNFPRKLQNFKSHFNFSNIFDGFALIKYYYIVLIPICFTIFVTFMIYPHIIPNILKKEVYYKFLYLFIYQICDLLPNILLALHLKFLDYINQKIVLILSLSRILLIFLSLAVKNSPENSFLYSNEFIIFLMILIGLTNGSLINLSYERIPSCFKNSENIGRNIAVASSFSSLSFLISLALAPWFCNFVIDY